MGTNYYWHEKEPCKHCGREFDGVHIGKSSAGWHFALHVYPDDSINTLDDWKRKFNKDGSYICDEYYHKITVGQMLNTITNRSWNRSSNVDEEWYKENCAHEGLNGLAAHNVGRHCIGNTEGTYDYITGEFS